ncbi:MAG: alanine:cation symporter family protein, partial [Clostridia bacterium]|nr:alanine:cation symporter family protein [Clostridia bacterium]
MSAIVNILDKIDSVMYYPILIIVLVFGGLYFTARTRFVQVRLFRESCRLIMEPPTPPQKISSFQAMIVSTASRVGTGNIVGVSSAICLGGPGAVFWMWLMCIIGASSAFTESTLAQIYKKKDENGDAYGGPAYYIEKAFRSRIPAVLFCFFLLMTYSFGFQLLCSFNLQTTFQAYSFYDAKTTPYIIGVILAVLTGYCIFGGGKRIIKLTSSVVPVMGIFYVIIALIVI